jgi:NADH dehydrogenase (ubiquinone) flavoprotein 2
VECLGSCANAPMVQMNDDYYECLTPETTIALLELCKKGTPPKMGKWGSLPMNGQVSCEGPKGKTSLKEPAPGPGAFFRYVCLFIYIYIICIYTYTYSDIPSYSYT